MKIDVAYVAELARLELTDEEKSVFQPQLENIVKYVEKISEVDVEGVEPMMHGRPLVNAFREDVEAEEAAGMNGHISKPIDIPRMMETLRCVLRQKEEKE